MKERSRLREHILHIGVVGILSSAFVLWSNVSFYWIHPPPSGGWEDFEIFFFFFFSALHCTQGGEGGGIFHIKLHLMIDFKMYIIYYILKLINLSPKGKAEGGISLEIIFFFSQEPKFCMMDNYS